MEITDTETVHRSGPATTLLTGFVPGPDRGGSRRWRAALRTTPARIVLYGAVLVLLLIATAVVALRSGDAARNLGRDDASAAAQSSAAAQKIYSKLADTDVAANRLLLSDDAAQADRQSAQKAYDALLVDIDGLLVAAVSKAVEDPERLARLAALSARFEVYQQVVDEALKLQKVAAARKLKGSPADAVPPRLLASAYAREATHYMRAELLHARDGSDTPVGSGTPEESGAAQKLIEHDTELLREAYGDASWWAAASVGTPLLVLVALGAVQRWLWHRTRRRLNAGLLVAALSMAAVLGLVVTSWLHWPGAQDQFEDVRTSIEKQDKTRGQLREVLAGRADIYLALGNSTEPAGHQQDFEKRELCEPGSEKIDEKACRMLPKVWTAREGDFSTAVKDMRDDGDIGGPFTRRAKELSDDLGSHDTDISQQVTALREAPGQLGGIAASLTLLAGVGVVLGLRRRLVEYR